MDERERKETIRNASDRIIKNLENMSGYGKRLYIEKLVAMLDETHMVALDFALTMMEKTEKTESTNS